MTTIFNNIVLKARTPILIFAFITWLVFIAIAIVNPSAFDALS